MEGCVVGRELYLSDRSCRARFKAHDEHVGDLGAGHLRVVTLREEKDGGVTLSNEG
jgi:hypothetical protein